MLENDDFTFKGNSKIIFSQNVIAENRIKQKEVQLCVHENYSTLKTNIVTADFDELHGAWLIKIFSEYSVENMKKPTLQQLKSDFEENFENFELFWFSKPMQQLKENGVILSL